MIVASDVPLLNELDPNLIPYQYQVIEDVRCNFKYRPADKDIPEPDAGIHQIMLSGSVGSAKSLLMAHIIVTHCIENPGAIAGIGRLTMPDLKDTLLKMILDHLGEPGEIIDYDYNKTESTIYFPENKSTIMSFSWHDKKYKKFRSHKFSLFAIEELTENDDSEAISAIIQRLGRLGHVEERLLICATNPDDPEHWAHKWFIERENQPLIHVYYSLTEQNPFLEASYIEMLKENLDEKMAQRMLYGKWVAVGSENIYYNYNNERNYLSQHYEIDYSLPVRISWDFNIAEGKPLSAVLFQYTGAFHWFDEVVIHSARTEDALEELANRGVFDWPCHFIIHGDATGKSRDTRSKRSDYEIIRQFLANYQRKNGGRVHFEIQVPRSNPPVRKRHNLMNGLMRNVKGQVRFFVYAKAKTLHEGCRLTKLKKGGQYIEDDSKPYQHITTAAGYGAHTTINGMGSKKQGTVQL